MQMAQLDCTHDKRINRSDGSQQFLQEKASKN